MDFGSAITVLKRGVSVAREGWNGKGMWVHLMERNSVAYTDPETDQLNSVYVLEPFFVIKNVQGSLNTWVPSISDLLAEDWEVAE